MRFPILAVETRSAGFGVAVWAFQCATRLERARSFVDATVMFPREMSHCGGQQRGDIKLFLQSLKGSLVLSRNCGGVIPTHARFDSAASAIRSTITLRIAESPGRSESAVDPSGFLCWRLFYVAIYFPN